MNKEKRMKALQESKIPFLVAAMLFLLSSHMNAQENYLLKINDELIPISLDGTKTITVDSVDLTLSLIQKDTLTYVDTAYEFNYLKDFSITKTVIDLGIEQLMLVSADGSGAMIQKYGMMNPSMLNEMMLSEITKESISYGYKLKREDYDRKMENGEVVKVLKAVLEYKNLTSIYEVASFGKRDEGVLVVTMIPDMELSTSSNDIIELMWHSFRYK